MTLTEKVKIGDREIVVRELTMAQIRNVMRRLETQEHVHIIDLMMEDMPAVALSEATGLSLEELEGDFTQTEIKKLKDVVVKLNPFLAKMLKRLAQIGQQALKS